MSKESCTDPAALLCDPAIKTITGQNSGEITSPGYPCPYGISIACVWQVEVDPNRIVKIEFDEFDLEPEAANLTLYNSWDTNSDDVKNQLAKFTGNIAEEVTSSSNRIAIQFNTDTSEHQNKGFKLLYKSITSNYHPPNPTNDNVPLDSSQLGTEAIVGIAVGSAALILVLIVAGILLHNWMKKKSRVNRRPDDVDNCTVPTTSNASSFGTIRQEVPSMYRSDSSGDRSSRTSHVFIASVNNFPRLPTYDEATNENSGPTSRNFGDRMVSFACPEAHI